MWLLAVLLASGVTEKRYVIVDVANVREGPALGAPIIRQLRINTRVHIVGTVQDWAQVAVPWRTTRC